ncbi:DUF89 family protein [candidate division KSB1 bacterium]|nr:DUF89 family protein [candidate division KSB1 bacterium]
MKTYLDCFPCVLRHALQSARMTTPDERVQHEVLVRVLRELTRFPLSATPPEITQTIHRIIKEKTGNKDPYVGVKRKYNEIALRMYPDLKRLVSGADDSLFTACKLAIAGNIIDFGALGESFDLEQTIKGVLNSAPAINRFDELRRDILGASGILYLGDNAGEIVFDRILVEEILNCRSLTIKFVVKGEPILNDATLEDAKFVGMDRICEVIPDGHGAPATILTESSPEVRRAFDAADVVIAKGQGNYETLSETGRPVYFLLKVKCPVVARDLGCQVGDSVIHRSTAIIPHIDPRAPGGCCHPPEFLG